MNLKQHLDRQAAITRLPSPEQAKAGNYLKGRVKAHGLPVVIENARGSMRRGVGPGGKAWAVKMPAHYGYISRTEGADGDHVDVYLGVHLNSPKIYVLDQNHADTGKFDEHKVFMGFASHRQVLAAYRKAFTDGKADKRFGVLHEMTREQFHDWLQKGDTTKALHRASGGRVAMADGGDPEAEPSGRPRVYITGNPEEGLLPTYNDEPARNPSESRPLFPLFPQKSDPDNLPAPLVAGAGLANVYTGLTGTAGKERFQTWPEKMVRSGASLPHDVMSGEVPQWEADPVTGEMHTSTPMIERAQDTAGMAGGTSFGALDTSAATLGAGPVRRAPSVEPTITNRGNGAYDVHVDGQFAGVANVASDGNKPFLSSISLEPQFQRQGIGSQVYQAIESDIGRPLVPSPLGLTDSATAFWKNRLSGVPDNQRAAMIEESKKIGRGYGVKEDWLTDRFAPLLLSDSGKPGAAIAGARRALPMDEASRMARAAEQGYTVDAFKGGQPNDWATIPERNGRGEIVPGTENRIPQELTEINSPNSPYAGFFSDSPDVANRFAAPFEYGGVWPTKLKFDNPLVIDASGHHAADFQFSSLARERGTTEQMQAFHDAFTKGNHDGVILKNTKDEGTVYIPKNPEQIRSRFAAFDPKNVGRSGLLLSDSAAPGAPLAALEKGSRFYSGLSRAVDAVQQPRMTGDQWLGTLSNKPGVKPEELQYTGLSDFLNARRGQPVTKDEIAQHLDSNAVKLEEVMKGDKRTSTTGETIFQARDRVAMDAYNEPYGSLTNYQRAAVDDEMRARTPTKYHDYQLPGGENYRELLMTNKRRAIPQEFGTAQEARQAAIDAGLQGQGATIRETDSGKFGVFSQSYKSSHWDEPNILAHMRMNDRTIDGKRSLHLEEIQSDWHQQGRDQGYRVEKKPFEIVEVDGGFKIRKPDGGLEGMNPEGAPYTSRERAQANIDAIQKFAPDAEVRGVPDAPFKKTWHELALKRALHEAAEKGYDRLSWTPGEAQAARYDLSKQIESLKATPVMDQHGLKYEIRAKGKGGTTEPINTVATEAELPNIVGKEMAQKIVEQTEGKKPVNFSGLDLKVGGEGMKGFYDQIIPKAVEKIGKEYGLKAQKGSLGKPAPEGPFEVRNAGTNAHGEDIFNVYDGTGKMVASDFKSKNAAEDAAITMSYAKPRKSEPVWYVDLPPETRQRMLHKGFSLFEDSAFTGAPMSALEHLNDPAHKIRAIRKRGQGIATGKSAKGWEFKRPDPVKGTWDRHVAEVKHGWESDKRGALNEFGDAINPNMKPEDWDFMTSGNFRARGGRTGFASGGAPAFDPDKPFDAAPDFDPDKPFDAAPATPTGEDKGAWNAAGRGAYQGATFNFGDELRGLGEAGGVKPDEWNDPISTVKGAYKYWTGDKGAEQSYDAAVTRERQADKLAAEQHPIAYHGAEIAGSIPSSLMLPGGSVARGATLANRARQGATLGVVAGGLSGAGDGEDAGSRLTGAGIGAVTGGAGGALAAPATDLAGYALKRTLGPAWNAIVTTARGSEREAARRVYTALQADEVDIAAGKMNGMTIQQWQAAKAAGEPVTLADLGGARTQSLLRSSANTSPEARGTLEKAIGDRFDDQSTRVARDVRSLVNGGANAHKTADQLVAEYDVARAPAYKAAFLHPNASSLWDGDFEQMATAPAVQQAIKMASVNARDEAAKLGLKPPVNPFTFNRDGTVGLTDPNFKPNLQFWDVVKKNLDGGDRQSQQWAKILRNKLDTYDTGYNKARGIAADFFGERDALQAGRTLAGKNVDPQVIAAQLRKMNPQERDLFREGYASDWAGRVIENTSDSRDITKAMFNSPAERKRAEIIFGPQGLQTLQNRMTLETVMDGARKALGNSTTARQLIEAGLAGGAVGGYLDGDWKGAAAGALSGAGARKALGTEMAAGARKLIGKVDAKTAARVADLLTSNDPRKLAQGMRIMNANKKVADGMRAIADRMLNTTQAQAPRPRLNIDTTGWSGGVPARADQEQQQP